MLRRLPLLLVMAATALTLGSAQNLAKRQENNKSVTFEGCLDEKKAAQYVLLDDSRLKLKAELEAAGFPNESFAKFLGQKVKVTGAVSGEGDRTVVKVRTIEVVSETCSPAPPK